MMRQDRHLPHPHADRIVERIGDRCRDARAAELTDAARANRTGMGIELVDEADIDASEGMSALTGTATFDRFLARNRAAVCSTIEASIVALPHSQVIEPIIWLRAVSGLMIRPAE